MVNQLFDPGREGFADGTVNWITPVIKAALVRGYTFSAAHKFVSQVTGAGGTLVSTSAALSGKTATSGICDADDTVWASVAAGAAVPHVILFMASAVGGGADIAATSQRLIGFIDTGTFLPVTPNGQNITSAWDNTAGTRIFKL